MQVGHPTLSLGQAVALAYPRNVCFPLWLARGWCKTSLQGQEGAVLMRSWASGRGWSRADREDLSLSPAPWDQLSARLRSSPLLGCPV